MNRAKIVVIISIVVVLILSFTIGQQIYAGRQPGIASFALIHFAGYLFFLLMPVELLYIFYLIEEVNVFILLPTALATALVAEIIDYIIGRAVSTYAIEATLGEKRHKKMQKHIQRYGNLAVFFFNALPLSSSVLSLAAGMLRYNVGSFLLYSTLGLVLKYLVITLVLI